MHVIQSPNFAKKPFSLLVKKKDHLFACALFVSSTYGAVSENFYLSLQLLYAFTLKHHFIALFNQTEKIL